MINNDAALVAELTAAAHEAMLARDWDRLRLMLHPYLHLTTADGRRLRGRTKVMAWLQNAAPPAQPITVELRDGQIYRWQEPGRVVRSRAADRARQGIRSRVK